MLMLCDKCNQQDEAKLDSESDKVICGACGGEITNVSSFTKASMRRSREFITAKKEAFSFSCDRCQKVQRGVLNKEKTAVLCAVCNQKLNVSAYMLKAFVDLSLKKDNK